MTLVINEIAEYNTVPCVEQLMRYKGSVSFSPHLNKIIGEMFDITFFNTSGTPTVQLVTGQPYADFAEMKKDILAGRLLISTDFCDNNIFGSEVVNQQFRAIHDYLHFMFDLDFTYENELLVNYNQAIVFKRAGATPYDLDLLNIETAGQIYYHKTTGNFPENQRVFTINELSKMGY